jgi:hypothetical protein
MGCGSTRGVSKEEEKNVSLMGIKWWMVQWIIIEIFRLWRIGDKNGNKNV